MISKTCESVQKKFKVCVITVLEREDIERKKNTQYLKN